MRSFQRKELTARKQETKPENCETEEIEKTSRKRGMTHRGGVGRSGS